MIDPNKRFLLSYEYKEVDNEFYKGKVIVATFACDMLGGYKTHYINRKEFLDDIEGDNVSKDIMEILEKRRKGMYSEEVLKKDLLKILDIKTKKVKE